MSSHHGKNGRVKVGSVLVAETQKWSLTENTEVADTTTQGDTAQTHLVGIPGWSGSVEALLDRTDTTGQGALTIGASVTLGLYSEGTAVSKKYRSGTATITSINEEVDMGSAVKVTFNFQGNGPLSTDTVPA